MKDPADDICRVSQSVADWRFADRMWTFRYRSALKYYGARIRNSTIPIPSNLSSISTDQRQLFRQSVRIKRFRAMKLNSSRAILLLLFCIVYRMRPFNAARKTSPENPVWSENFQFACIKCKLIRFFTPSNMNKTYYRLISLHGMHSARFAGEARRGGWRRNNPSLWITRGNPLQHIQRVRATIIYGHASNTRAFLSGTVFLSRSHKRIDIFIP